MEFSEFGFSEELMIGLDSMNFRKPTPVQEMAIPRILEGKDILASAQTGTGKTAAFLLPLLESSLKNPGNHIHTLIIVPTRELGLQIAQQLEGFAYFVPVSSIAVYGGGDGREFEIQKRALREGTEIVVATPGKLLSHLNMGYVDMSQLRHLVLDEVDRMLDMGFIDDINRILTHLPAERQTLFFSATMPPKIRQLAIKLLKDPAQINISISKPAEGVKQSAYLVYDTQKIDLLKSILANRDLKSGILFAGRKQRVKEIERELKRSGINVGAIHSDLEQNEREEVLLKFRNRQIALLVATDVVSRGIDVQGIELVINYDVPGDPEDYVHRVGRTARAETKGEAITLVNPDDIRRFKRIEEMIEREVDKLALPESFGDGPDYSSAASKTSPGRSKGVKPKSKQVNKPTVSKPAEERPIRLINVESQTQPSSMDSNSQSIQERPSTKKRNRWKKKSESPQSGNGISENN